MQATYLVLAALLGCALARDVIKTTFDLSTMGPRLETPMTEQEASDKYWFQIREDGPNGEHRFWHENDPSRVISYNADGDLVSFSTLTTKAQGEDSCGANTSGGQWCADTEVNGVEYCALTVHFNTADNGIVLREAVRALGVDEFVLPMTAAEIEKDTTIGTWKPAGCIPGMGMHWRLETEGAPFQMMPMYNQDDGKQEAILMSYMGTPPTDALEFNLIDKITGHKTGMNVTTIHLYRRDGDVKTRPCKPQ